MQSIRQYSRELASLPSLTLLGISLISIDIAAYSIVEGSARFLSAESAATYEAIAYLYFAVLLTGIFLAVFGLWRTLKKRIMGIREAEEVPFRIGSLIPYIFANKKVSKIFIVSSFLYGLFYSFVTSIIIYRPEMKFSEIYSISTPTIQISPCCGPPGQIPVLVGYVTDNIGLLILPLTLLTLVLVSGLVALNVSLTYYAWKNRPSISKQGWSVGLGAAIGLFTGCPTCAGLFLASMVGGAGATTLALSLAPFQALIVVVTIPVLLFTPYMILGNIAKAVGGNCIILHHKIPAEQKTF